MMVIIIDIPSYRHDGVLMANATLGALGNRFGDLKNRWMKYFCFSRNKNASLAIFLYSDFADQAK